MCICYLPVHCPLYISAYWTETNFTWTIWTLPPDLEEAGCQGQGDQDMAHKAHVEHVVELVYLRYILRAGAPLTTWKEHFKITMKWKRGEREPFNYHDQISIISFTCTLTLGCFLEESSFGFTVRSNLPASWYWVQSTAAQCTWSNQIN